MKKQLDVFFGILISILAISCVNKQKPSKLTIEAWVIETQQDWQENIIKQSNINIVDGKIIPIDSVVTFKSTFKKFTKKQSVKSITLSQSAEWLNWKPVSNVGPSNLGDAPVALQLGEGNYWMFGKYNKSKDQNKEAFVDEIATLKGFDVELRTTPFKNQYNAPGGLKPGKGGYHAWQSHDMVNWVHHGAVSEGFSRWVTTAEYVDGKLYLYYDFPNDQDPHLYIDEDLTDGEPGENMGMVFKDPSHGSDCAVIRDLNGDFHLIVEDWSPIDASTHAWDSPLAVHAVSSNGMNDFKIGTPPVDERTKPTGEFGEYVHPHWHLEAPDRFPGKKALVDIPQHRVKAGQIYSFAKYEIHEPEQNSYGDWASICIDGQYYLFADYDPAGSHGRKDMSVAWFTSDDITKPFAFCGNIGKGHPDPDIVFAEGQFYLLTQMETDYISSGPWVETVELRVGVDTTNDGVINQWSNWQIIKEEYNCIENFAKQIEKTPAKYNVSELTKGYGFQFEVRVTGTSENKSKPVIDKMVILFEV